MKVFFDTSAFVKRYVEERGSATVEDLCMRATSVALSILAVTETLSAFNRRMREKNLPVKKYNQIKTAFFEDIVDIELISLDTSIVEVSIHALESHPLKTLDALQIACALYWQADLFVSSDAQQIVAAQKMGLMAQQV